MDKDISFFEKVYDITRKIPYGRVTTYGAIANYLGTPRSSRMVGWALNNSHQYSDIPAHRVVNRTGILSGKHHFQGTNLMAQLLGNEGIEISEDKVVDFPKYFWDPGLNLV